MRKLLRRFVAEDAGINVVELTIAVALLMVIVGAALSMLESGTRAERISQARNDAQTTLRTAMNQMTKELRQAVSVSASSNQTTLDMQTLIGGAQHHVVYQVVGTAPNATLQRTMDGGAAGQLASRIVASQAFCYQFNEPDCLATSPPADITAIRISLQITPVVFSSGTVTLATDVQLRNELTS